MNRIYLLIITLFMMLASCSNSNDDVEQGENGNTNKESIVALWQDSDKEPENVVSFTKDGTYKIILKKSAYSYFFSTGRYSVKEGKVSCKDNFVESSSKEYTFSIDTNGTLRFESIVFKKVGIEENALENKLNGRNQKYGGYTMGGIGYTYITGHKSELSQSLKEYSPFRYHYEIFKDSLTDESEDYDMITSELSYHYLDEYVKRLKKRAPYGFFTDWGWDSEYSCISFHFNYMNTNRNTIKYIDVYFKVTNDVGDLRKTGHFQGTGPLREFESASWEWDTSYYYVSGDASNMNITKVILTYMNGTKKVLTGNLLVFE